MILIVKRATCDDCGKVIEVDAEKKLPDGWQSVLVHVAPPDDLTTKSAKLVCSLRCAGAMVLKEGDKLARKAEGS